MEAGSEQSESSECPICCKTFPPDTIQVHVERCIFLNCTSDDEKNKPKENKRTFSVFNQTGRSPTVDKKKFKKAEPNSKRSIGVAKVAESVNISDDDSNSNEGVSTATAPSTSTETIGLGSGAVKKKPPTVDAGKSIPLAEKMRPETIEDYIGQSHIMGKDTILRKILDKNETPSMILWGPPGVGKTTLANIIAQRAKATQNIRFVKLSATMAGVNDVKQAVTVAKNEQKFGRKTILFMDEIHRFNKLQQDIFLPHVESGTVTLIGATTENPSFSLNSALLSRCRVMVLEKLSSDNVFEILRRSLRVFEAVLLNNNNPEESAKGLDYLPKIAVEEPSLRWLADICDGDARIALNSLQLAMESITEQEDEGCEKSYALKWMKQSAIEDGIKRSHMLYDRKGDQHYEMISALHKSIRASDENATLYWCTRMMVGGEDPRYICRRLVRAASEDIGLADPHAVSIALTALDAVQLVGMPESDVIIAQAAVYLARAPKSREMQDALSMCKRDIESCKGPQPAVPLHLRNASTKLATELGYGRGYNMRDKDHSGLNYMPEELEGREYF